MFISVLLLCATNHTIRIIGRTNHLITLLIAALIEYLSFDAGFGMLLTRTQLLNLFVHMYSTAVRDRCAVSPARGVDKRLKCPLLDRLPNPSPRTAYNLIPP